MKSKAFDCVEFQDRAGERIYNQIKGMSFQEQLEFWRKQTEILRQHQDAALRKQSVRRPVRSHPKRSRRSSHADRAG